MPCNLLDTANQIGERVDAVIWGWIRELFEDKELSEAAIRRYLERSEEEIAPLKENLQETNALIEEKELALAQHDYREFKDTGADRTKATLKADIERLESVLDGLDSKRATIEVKLTQATLSENELQTIRKYANSIRQGLDIAHACFDERRWLIDKLDVRATLTIEDGQKIAYVECRLGEESDRPEIEDDSLLSHTVYGIL